MVIKGRFPATETLVFERLDGILFSRALPNGTPLAAALATALAVDARLSGTCDILRTIDGLSIGQVVDLAFDLEEALASDCCSFTLPNGSRCASADRGGVSIAEEVWVLDAGLPGLHPLQIVRRDAHGPNLEALRAEIGRLTAGTPLARMGLPSPVFRSESDGRNMLQFQPFAEAGGVVLQRWATGSGAMRFCAATPAQIEQLAASMIADMKLFWKRRRHIAADAKRLRTDAAAVLEDHGASGTAMRAVVIDLSWQHRFDEYDYYVEYDGLDHALRSGVALDFVPARSLSEKRYRRVPDGISSSFRDLEDLRSKGADGEIDDVTAALLRASPQGAAAILERLSRDAETSVTFPTPKGPLYALLYWRSGFIESEICVPGHFEWTGQTLVLRPGRPLDDAAVRELVGTTLSRSFDLPIDFAGVIRHARQEDVGTLVLSVDNEMLLVNTRTGRIL